MGWATFAAIMLIVGGCFAIIAGIAGIAEDDILVRTQEWVFNFDTTTWGWIHSDRRSCRAPRRLRHLQRKRRGADGGRDSRHISAVINFMWLPYYPVWSVVVIAIDIAVIWALTAHGRDLAREAREG